MKSLDEVLYPCEVIIPLAARNYGRLVNQSERVGIGIHFDDSSSDRGAENWFRDPAFKLSYNRAYTDSGRRIRLTPSIWYAASHMGVCIEEPGKLEKTALSPKYLWPDGRRFEYGWANGGYFGLCITAGVKDTVTDQQYRSLAYDAALIGRYMGWRADDVERWIVGHNEKAIFNPKDNATQPKLWGKLGRKVDPIGYNPDKPVLSLRSLRVSVATLLDHNEHPLWERLK